MKPRLAVFKFASCDGCQLQLLNAGEALLALAALADLAYFPEASSRLEPGPYDVALVEGSISTAADADRIAAVRADSRILVTIGACATAGGIQALRNWAAPGAFAHQVYPRPELIDSLATSTPIAAHVRVDYELWGCPIDREQVLSVLRALLAGVRPALPGHSVCMECKRRGHTCVVVAQGVPCLGPVTRTGCGAICPGMERGCYGCFGPCDDPNMAAFTALLAAQGVERAAAVRCLRGVAGWAKPWRETSDDLAAGTGPWGGR
jgi:coenzyme F420-reducing hydrogenase gamma subunit